MSIFDLFKRKPKLPRTESLHREIVETGDTIVYASDIPRTVDIGNLVSEIKYEEAITLGKELLSLCNKNHYNYLSMIHINLMDAYFKARNTNDTYFNQSTYHAKQAILNGHSTGYAHIRLAINLEKQHFIKQAIELCDHIINKDFVFSKHGCGNDEDFEKRKDKLFKKINLDKSSEPLFTKEDIGIIKTVNKQ